jgi:transcriptional regulator with XRE-family HTH domain
MKSIHDARYLEILAQMRAARISKGWSQAELASVLGKPQSYVAKIETGERRIDLMETLMLCEALEITLHAVIPSEWSHLLHPHS